MARAALICHTPSPGKWWLNHLNVTGPDKELMESQPKSNPLWKLLEATSLISLLFAVVTLGAYGGKAYLRGTDTGVPTVDQVNI